MLVHVSVTTDPPRQQYMVLSGVVAMVSCAVFLRLSCVLQLAFLLLAAIFYAYIMETHRYGCSCSSSSRCCWAFKS